jgi:hypothetical protein
LKLYHFHYNKNTSSVSSYKILNPSSNIAHNRTSSVKAQKKISIINNKFGYFLFHFRFLYFSQTFFFFDHPKRKLLFQISDKTHLPCYYSYLFSRWNTISSKLCVYCVCTLAATIMVCLLHWHIIEIG